MTQLCNLPDLKVCGAYALKWKYGICVQWCHELGTLVNRSIESFRTGSIVCILPALKDNDTPTVARQCHA